MIAEIWSGDSKAIPKPLGAVVTQMLENAPRKRPPLAEVKSALEACCAKLKSA
jgi:hypothetical protein